MYRSHVLVCGGTGCTSSNSAAIIEALESEIKKHGLENEVKVVRTGCFGLCARGPIMVVYPEGSYYSLVKPEDVPEIVEEHLLKGRIVKRLLFEEFTMDDIKSLKETDFYKKQHRVALRNCGVIDTENINEYIAYDGYAALAKCLSEYTPAQVIDIISESGLRGRGGGGFPTGKKWSFTAAQKSVRAEYPIAVKRLEIAIGQAREYGLLGKNIFDSGFDFDLHIRLGAGAFVCGEETALMTSIEGNRGEPRPRPPYPAVKGLFGKPTTENNVETFANVAQIILNGADWFASMGTERSKGTKVFALGGKIKNTGLVEIPMGTTLREIVEEIGGGIPGGKKFKAAQTGGPSGGCIPAALMDTPIDYDNLTAIGCMMGSGGLIVMDEDDCMVDIAKFFLNFTVDESCGKCTPCRVGTKRLLEMLEKITSGNATLRDLDKLEELCHYIKANSLCGLGQTAPNPVLATLKFFRDEYVAHVVDKKCPAGVCKALLSYEILEDRCRGCTACARKCPVGAISGNVKEPHVINKSLCVKCGVCMQTCKFGAIVKR